MNSQIDPDHAAAPIITIDGPSGVGKTTVAQHVSKTIGLPFLASGRLFRALAYVMQSEGITENEAILKRSISLDLIYTHNGGILYQGHDISDRLYDDAIGLYSSQIAQIPGVRDRLDSMMRNFGRHQGCVAEGRSTGLHVFPEALLKIWLTADYQTRYDRIARSRSAIIAEQTMLRDKMDAKRAVAPIMKAADAIEIDSTTMTAEEVSARIISLYRQTQKG